MRHAFASRLALSGPNPSTIAALLRHFSLDLVRRYAHLNQPHLKAAVGMVAAYVRGHSEPGTGKRAFGGRGERYA
ncbi:hypothetical protein YTPLAS18_12290 [Nitrospira sp.]|nr:hypothetical protein YTPLAS18_12290 [Nitrospira sp.]